MQTPEWKAKRKEAYKRDGYQCVECKKYGVCLHCHHGYYVKGMKPWEYPLDALETLCEMCHGKRQQTLKFDSHDDAEMWLIMLDIEKQIIDQECLLINERIDCLTDRGAEWNAKGRYWGLVDDEGISRFFDEFGNPL